MRDGAAPTHTLSTFELVAMVAALSALNAFAIDIMLPALPDIGRQFALAHDNDRQLVIVIYVALFGISQLVYGPLADAYGRRSVLIGALGAFIVGSILCVIAPTFELLLAARALQGVGAAATRVIATAVVRDLSSGRRMAQVMSMAMAVFMVAPIIAPGIGQLILFVAPWQWTFGALLAYAIVVLIWALIRLPETLRPENTTPFRPRAIAGAYAAVLRSRQTAGYMVATIFMVACLFGYITSSEQIYVEVYDLGAAFPIAFASVALVMSFGSLLNSRLVMRFGMRRIAHTMVIAFTLLSLVIAVLAELHLASFWVFLVMAAMTFGMFNMVAGNFNALAMDPVGHVAGSASALYGAVTATGGAALGALIARAFDGTIVPFAVGMAAAGAATLITVLITERGKLFSAGGPGSR